jgi:hypothetical protein
MSSSQLNAQPMRRAVGHAMTLTLEREKGARGEGLSKARNVCTIFNFKPFQFQTTSFSEDTALLLIFIKNIQSMSVSWSVEKTTTARFPAVIRDVDFFGSPMFSVIACDFALCSGAARSSGNNFICDPSQQKQFPI